MPFFGIGLHVLIAIYFAIHAVRHGQPLYWLVILFMFPLLGSAVYFFAIYLPNSKFERTANRALSAAVKVLDPTKELRVAQSAFEYTPTAQNQMRLAEALLNAGQPKEAASHYEACLNGPFANDLNIRYGAAMAHFSCEHFEQALTQLQYIQQENQDFRPEQISLLTARTLAALNKDEEAKAAFEYALARFGSMEIKIEMTLWALAHGQQGAVSSLQVDIQRTIERWDPHTRELNQALVKRYHQALHAHNLPKV